MNEEQRVVLHFFFHKNSELAIAREAVKIVRFSLEAASSQLGLDPTAAGIAEAGVDRNFVCACGGQDG